MGERLLYLLIMENTMNRIEDARREQLLRELASDLADQVASGDLTDVQANEWYNAKADQWAGGRS
jgi:hypothetical protein